MLQSGTVARAWRLDKEDNRNTSTRWMSDRWDLDIFHNLKVLVLEDVSTLCVLFLERRSCRRCSRPPTSRLKAPRWREYITCEMILVISIASANGRGRQGRTRLFLFDFRRFGHSSLRAVEISNKGVSLNRSIRKLMYEFTVSGGVLFSERVAGPAQQPHYQNRCSIRNKKRHGKC